MVSLCSPGFPGTHYVDQTGLELTELYLPLPLSARIKEVGYHMVVPGMLNQEFHGTLVLGKIGDIRMEIVRKPVLANICLSFSVLHGEPSKLLVVCSGYHYSSEDLNKEPVGESKEDSGAVS